MPAITTADYSQVIPSAAAVQVYPALPGFIYEPGQSQPGQSVPQLRSYLRIWNVNPSGGATVWLSRSGAAVVNGPGSYPLAPGQSEFFSGQQPVPVNALSAIGAGGSVALTVEVG